MARAYDQIVRRREESPALVIYELSPDVETMLAKSISTRRSGILTIDDPLVAQRLAPRCTYEGKRLRVMRPSESNPPKIEFVVMGPA